ncbi:hypothetical protein BH24ACT15_BH24ACT15_31360 [soil metagenome]
MEDAVRREIALFRYALVRQAADPALPGTERGRLVRDLAGRDHVGPDGHRRRVARSTLDEWIRAYRKGGHHRRAASIAPARAAPPPSTGRGLAPTLTSLTMASASTWASVAWS